MRLLQLKIVPVLLLATVAAISSCKKVASPEPFVPDRAFTPTGVSVTGGETSATISWNASLFSAGQGMTYKVEVYDNSSFTGTPAYTVDADTTTITVYDTDLAVRTSYWARVKANATTTSAESAGWAASTSSFSMTGEQFFLPIIDDNLTDISVELRWKPDPALTKIVITPASGAPADHVLTPGDLTATKKVITGLTPSTVYTAELFRGTASKGILSFTTKSATPSGSTVVNVAPADDLAALIAAAVPGTVFVLQQGTLYTADAEVVLPANAAFTIWGQYGPDRPVIAFNGFRLPTTAGTIRFENLDLTGYQNNDPSGAKRNYIFNQSAASSTQAIEFENCIIRNLVNTPFRLQGSNAITVSNLKFNKCTAYDIGVNTGGNGTYAFIHTNVATGKIENIRVTNSTLYNIGYSIILHNAGPSQSVLIENCTFDNVVGNARFFIDYNAQPAGSMQINNIIIGKSLSPAGTANGIRSSVTAPVVSNSFQVSNTGFVNNPIPAITNYSGSNTDLFTDPANGDFLIKDAGFTGKSTSGDPRWRL